MSCSASRSVPHAVPRSVMDAWLSSQCPGEGPLAERLEEARFQALREVLHRTREHSRWYSRTLAGLNLDIRCEADMLSLPFTTPQDLQDYRQFLCIPQGDVSRIVTLSTSGSTGTPKRIAFSENDLRRTASFFRHGMAQLVHRGERLMVLLPGADSPNGVTDLLHQALSLDGVTVYAGNPAATASTLKADILSFRPQALVAAPHQLAALLDAVREDGGLRAQACCVNGIQSSGDVLDAEVRCGLESLLSCEVLDHFGMTETCFGGGVECFARHGYHLRELDLFLEILDPRTLSPVAEGQVGELVLTTLNREAMPLIRYRTGDAASWLSGPCPCGSPLRRLAPLSGRWQYEGGVPVLRHIRKGGFHARTAPASLR